MSAEEDEMKEMVGGCCVCSDERGWDENPLVYCDGQGCVVAVHQACYGIVDVPVGPWYCRKCESHERSARVRCDLCPSRDGALKKTDQNGWAHVVCALYIPEVRFGNVTTMEPILVTLIPAERFNKTCYICEDNNRGSKCNFGACMQCNKPGCKQNFHVTCAQMAGLLCEEAGNMDNVKYCGYCQYHYGKLKTTRNMKIIPPFRPVSASNASNGESPVSSPEKSGTKASSEEPKSSTGGTSGSGGSIQRSLSTPGASINNTEGSSSSRKTSGPPNNISPDIDISTKTSKSSKKGNGSHSNSSKLLLDTPSSKSGGSSSITAKIAQPILTPATFSSSSAANKSININNSDDKSDSNKGSSKQGSNNKGEASTHGDTSGGGKNDDSLTIKLERVDNPLKNVSSQSKKDFTNVQLKEVVSAALDRPMTSSTSSSSSKFDHVSSALTSNIEPPLSSSTLNSGRHGIIGDNKPAPPDIKPHVTLTPIPMRGTRTSTTLSSSLSSRNEDKSKDDESGQKSKSPIVAASSAAASLSFHNSFGPPKLTSQTSSPDMSDSGSKSSKPPDLSVQDGSMDKNGPPAKRSRGTSRDDDRGRKTPTKGRGGRRGTTTTAYSKRETPNNNGFTPDDIPPDDPMEGSSRGGRNGPGRRPAAATRIGGRPTADDTSAPTLSQLKAQMENSADNSTLSALPPHMFGNALNPASSMAQRMVDTLSQEMEAVVAAGAGGLPDTIAPQAPVVGIPLPGKSNLPSSSTNGSTLPSTSASATSAAAATSAPPQTLEQLLERQWEQGSQFLMEQAQHLDIAQLLSCLNQLKQDNRALEEHVQSLVQRRDQLIAVNARLSVPLGNSNAMGSLGPGFSSNGSAHNGHNGTPPPTLTPQGHINQSTPKGLQISSSTPSPQQHHELIMQQGRHVHREERSYTISSEMQVSRTEIGGHAGPSSHLTGHHSQRSQNVAPYGYSGHSNTVPTSHPLTHPHSSHHNMSRDSSR